MDLLAGFMLCSVNGHYFTSQPQPVIENKSSQTLQVPVAWVRGQHLKRKLVFPRGEVALRSCQSYSSAFLLKGEGLEKPFECWRGTHMHRLKTEARNVV